MKIHEYQAKEIFSRYGIPVPRGSVASTPSEARAATEGFGGRAVRQGSSTRRWPRQGGRRQGGAIP